MFGHRQRRRELAHFPRTRPDAVFKRLVSLPKALLRFPALRVVTQDFHVPAQRAVRFPQTLHHPARPEPRSVLAHLPSVVVRPPGARGGLHLGFRYSGLLVLWSEDRS